jgi:AcrR family transcriptional regulator
MRGKGLVRATTKEIARAAGLSEGTLYNHFANKEELFLCTLNELPSGFVSLIRGLQERAGTEAVQSVLEQIARSALDFYGEAIPMGASFFADPELLARHRELLQQRGAGPQRANEAVAAYLRTEQGIGRVRGDADPDAVAYMLLGALYQYIYWRQCRESPEHSRPSPNAGCLLITVQRHADDLATDRAHDHQRVGAGLGAPDLTWTTEQLAHLPVRIG